MKPAVVFFSLSGNTRRFVSKLDADIYELSSMDQLAPDRAFIAVTPTYSNGQGEHAIPSPWKIILDDPTLSNRIVGVVACGDRSFISTFAKGGGDMAKQLNCPLIRQIELGGMPSDVKAVQEFIDKWI